MSKRHSTVHRVGTWNVQYGHPVAAHVQIILDEFETNHLDVLLLQEDRDYVHALDIAARKAGHTLVWFSAAEKGQGADQQAILVRGERDLGQTWTFEAGTGYYKKGGGEMPPMQPVCALVDEIAYGSVHAPVSVNWPDDKPVGPVRRVTAYIGFSRRLLRLFNRQTRKGRALCIGGDWNATRKDHGLATPNWLAKLAGALIVALPGGTGHGPIDFPIVKGCRASNVKVHPARVSDHRLVTWTVTSKARKEA